MPQLSHVTDAKHDPSSFLMTDYDVQAEKNKADHNCRLLNQDQRVVYVVVLENVTMKNGAVFFVDGAGGTGKTFLYNTTLQSVCSTKLTALAIASSGIAAELLDGGQAAHSQFKIPTPIQPHSMCNIPKNSALATLIKRTSVIILDEAPMMHKQVFECLLRSLCDILETEKSFGGLIVLLGGDIRQVLPVIRHGHEADIVESNLKRSFLWQEVQLFHLTINR